MAPPAPLEILAGALQDYKTAPRWLANPRTVRVQCNLFDHWSDGAALHNYRRDLVHPQAQSIEGTGLQPDVAVPYTEHDRQTNQDPQMTGRWKY